METEHEAGNGVTGIIKLLLVDDNLVNCEVAIDMLEVLGFDVDVAHNGEEALEMYDRSQHALILMDCEMPVMNGFATTKKIREKEKELNQAPKPIIALTAHAVKGAKETCIEHGMDDFISKPFTLSSLRSMLDKWLNSDLSDLQSAQRSDDVSSLENQSQNNISHNDGTGVLDSEILKRLSMRQRTSNSSLLNQAAELYLAQSSGLLRDLSEASQTDDIAAVKFAAHALKSSSANIGALDLSTLCGTVEQRCEQGEIEKSLVQQVIQTYPLVEAELNDVINGKVKL